MAKKLDGTRRKSNAGRPTKDTPEVRRKIEEAAALDASVEEIAFYADISRDVYYDILKRDPVFGDRIAALRQKPILAARQAAIKHSTESYANAIDYLKRKRRTEFSDRIEMTGADGGAIQVSVDSETKEAINKALNDI